MKNKDFIQTAIILPVVLGLVLSIAFFCFFKTNSDIILPIKQNTAIAYHDAFVQDNGKISDKKTFSKLVPNDNIGTMSVGKKKLTIRFNPDDSNRISCLALMPGSVQFGEAGTIYISAYYNNEQVFEKANEITVESIFGKYKYEKYDSLVMDHEYKIKSSAYEGKSLIIYYQKTDGAGLSSKYQVMIYREVS